MSRAGTWTSDGSAGRTAARAFTLLELIVVLIVVGICASVTFPKVGGLLLREPEPWRSGRQLLHVVQYSRELAVATESTFVLSFDVNTGSYSVAGKESGAGGSELKGKLGDQVTVARIELTGNDWDPQRPVKVEFDPEGTCDPVTLSLISTDGQTVSVLIGANSDEIDPVNADMAGRV